MPRFQSSTQESVTPVDGKVSSAGSPSPLTVEQFAQRIASLLIGNQAISKLDANFLELFKATFKPKIDDYNLTRIMKEPYNGTVNRPYFSSDVDVVFKGTDPDKPRVLFDLDETLFNVYWCPKTNDTRIAPRPLAHLLIEVLHALGYELFTWTAADPRHARKGLDTVDLNGRITRVLHRPDCQRLQTQQGHERYFTWYKDTGFGTAQFYDFIKRKALALLPKGSAIVFMFDDSPISLGHPSTAEGGGLKVKPYHNDNVVSDERRFIGEPPHDLEMLRVLYLMLDASHQCNSRPGSDFTSRSYFEDCHRDGKLQKTQFPAPRWQGDSSIVGLYEFSSVVPLITEANSGIFLASLDDYLKKLLTASQKGVGAVVASCRRTESRLETYHETPGSPEASADLLAASDSASVRLSLDTHSERRRPFTYPVACCS